MNLTLPEIMLRRKLDKLEQRKLPESDPYFILEPGQVSAVALDENSLVVSWVDSYHAACQMFVYRSEDNSEWVTHPQLLRLMPRSGIELRPIPLSLAQDTQFIGAIEEAQRKRESKKRKA